MVIGVPELFRILDVVASRYPVAVYKGPAVEGIHIGLEQVRAEVLNLADKIKTGV